MSETHEPVKPHHKHRRGLGEGLVSALGFGRRFRKLTIPQESVPPADSEVVSDEYPVLDEIADTGSEAEIGNDQEECPIEQVPKTLESETASLATDAGMSYVEAIQVAQNGWRVCRTGWSKGIYVFVEDGVRIMKCTKGGHLPNQAIFAKFTPLVNDVLGNDWKVLPMANKTFQEAIEAMNNGQFARRSNWEYLLQIKENQFCSHDNPQQEYALRYEDIMSSDWEIHTN